MLASPIGWMGGKSRLRKTILEKIPEHVCWVELFCGAAWITFGKDKQISKTEVVNDTNGELSNFFRCVRDKYLELVAKIEFRVASKQDFEMIKQSWGGGVAWLPLLKWNELQTFIGISKTHTLANTAAKRVLATRLQGQLKCAITSI